MRIALLAVAALWLAGQPVPLAAQDKRPVPVDVELAFVVDASFSIDAEETRLQRQGYAAAITHPDVLAAIASGYDRRIAVTYVEWGDATSQEVVVPWTIIDGPESAAALAKRLEDCKTLVWNGPLGCFELPPFEAGTFTVLRAAAQLTKAGKLLSVAGGGDTVAALAQAGVVEDFSYVSSAGGAFLEWLEGKVLPGVAALAG